MEENQTSFSNEGLNFSRAINEIADKWRGIQRIPDERLIEWFKMIDSNLVKAHQVWQQLIKKYDLTMYKNLDKYILLTIVVTALYQIPYIYYLHKGSLTNQNSKCLYDEYKKANLLISRKMLMKNSLELLLLKYTYLILQIFLKKKKSFSIIAYRLTNVFCDLDIPDIDVPNYLRDIKPSRPLQKKAFDQIIKYPSVYLSEHFSTIQVKYEEALYFCRSSSNFQKIYK